MNPSFHKKVLSNVMMCSSTPRSERARSRKYLLRQDINVVDQYRIILENWSHPMSDGWYSPNAILLLTRYALGWLQKRYLLRQSSQQY